MLSNKLQLSFRLAFDKIYFVNCLQTCEWTTVRRDIFRVNNRYLVRKCIYIFDWHFVNVLDASCRLQGLNISNKAWWSLMNRKRSRNATAFENFQFTPKVVHYAHLNPCSLRTYYFLEKVTTQLWEEFQVAKGSLVKALLNEMYQFHFSRPICNHMIRHNEWK